MTRAHDPFGIDAPMAVKVLVLGRDEGVLDQVGNFVRRKIKPSLARIFGQQAAVGRVHARHHRRLIVLEQRVIWEVLFVFPHDAGKNRRRHDEQQRAGRKYETNNTSDPAHLSTEAFHCARRRALAAPRRTELRRLERPGLYETVPPTFFTPPGSGSRSNAPALTLSCSSKANL